jgi:hypothetical protein
MLKKQHVHVIEVEPTDSSPRGLEEIKYILEALFADMNACKTEEELKRYLMKEMARPKEEVARENRAIIQDAKRRFRSNKDS